MIHFKSSELFLITGGSSGLGKAIALRINELGGNVVAVGRNIDRLADAKQSATYPELFNYEIKDLSVNIDEIPEWFKLLAKKYDSFIGLVLSHGIMYMLPLQAEKVTKAKELFDTNFFSNIALIKGFSQKNVNAGKGSSIVCISSFTSQLGIPATSSYSASKAALNSLVRTSAIELSRNGIRVNAILSGHILTELLTSGKQVLSSSMIENLKSKYPLGLGEPKDVANLACFLLSNSARWITGSSFIIDGGASINF
jgi:NAD(P)-dependent dehydrogenase (short-subunit alcohol dehydrogenase family)